MTVKISNNGIVLPKTFSIESTTITVGISVFSVNAFKESLTVSSVSESVEWFVRCDDAGFALSF